MALGAGRPRLAVQVIGDTFKDRDWLTQSAPELVAMLSVMWGATWQGEPEPIDSLLLKNPDDPPWKAIFRRTSEVSVNENVPWTLLGDYEFQGLLNYNAAGGMLWGLRRGELVAQALESERQQHEKIIPESRAAGLTLPADYAPPTVNVFVDDCEEFVRSFERNVHPLLPIPPELSEHPELQRYISKERIAYP
jgi:hypothetical protein